MYEQIMISKILDLREAIDSNKFSLFNLTTSNLLK